MEEEHSEETEPDNPISSHSVLPGMWGPLLGIDLVFFDMRRCNLSLVHIRVLGLYLGNLLLFRLSLQ